MKGGWASIPARHLLLALAFLILVLGVPLLAPNDPFEMDLDNRIQPPSLRFPMGTDSLGRCVLSRTLYGGAVSVGLALAATLSSAALGMGLGLCSSSAGAVTRAVAMWMIDVMLAFPFLILAVVIAGLLGGSMLTTWLGLTAAGFVWWARFSSDLFIRAGESDFVKAARAMGIPALRLAGRYLLPQVMPHATVALLLQMAAMVTAVSGLSYLGFGAQPPTPEWGTMLKDAQIYMIDYPWLMIGPGLAITVCVAAFTAVGEALRRRFALKPLNRW
ncbi:MAG: peptide ABC transporter permease [Deltaproteobacteria bacterium CG23_combo_of_CG06-09_8_20_14_all_51_20]|nr:ABC transporter permease [bacterium]OIP39509.1 MAG: hypothetical protein AUK25_10130 [Desulfobacteraceae bacterium CG2_30_51_40]PIP45423.1 MAG: peptide ABC transporter permease [Deltaproteobacteria bacterium CG23_combo_of_CG06-09_8_20_14_all_51_20]PIY21606.1 MAG: peptide ABC transporter permease [Deltaproteobacteria bacterium CG_4_10_14_3_um_filter_51_14]PJB35791.1 MAG: peptide ABC transporter permease [Deltaproteobacteria bacterium CG_4_9_14_3_um_filter_51_14]